MAMMIPLKMSLSAPLGKLPLNNPLLFISLFSCFSDDMLLVKFSAQEFCSVGDDSCLILWDARTGTSPVTKVVNTIKIVLMFLTLCLLYLVLFCVFIRLKRRTMLIFIVSIGTLMMTI